MALAPMLAVLLSAAPMPRVAFTARFYWPEGDRRISYHHVYVCDIDFPEDGRYYAALENPKKLMNLGKKRVWGRRGMVGDLRSGKSWTVTPGVVHVGSISLSP